MAVCGEPATASQLNASADLDEIIQQTVGFVSQHNLANRVMLAIRSEHVLPVSFELRSKREARDPDMLLYRMEQFLPFGAEDTVADFVVRDTHCFGVGASQPDYLPIISGLENAGLRIPLVVPSALVCAQQVYPLCDGADFVLWTSQEGEDLIQFASGCPTNWWFRRQAGNSGFDEFAIVLASAAIESRRQLHGAHFGDPSRRPPQPFEEVQWQHVLDEDETEELVSTSARRLISGRAQPWVNLRNGFRVGDPLRDIQTPLRLLVASLIVFLIAVGAAFQVRARRLEARMMESNQRQRELFTQAFPNSRPPSGGIVSRLRSEVRLMKGARERTGEVDLPPSAALVLQEVLQGLPDSSTLEVRELMVASGHIDLDITVGTFSEVNELVRSLQAKGFAMSPPSSSQLDEVTVSARLLGDYQVRAELRDLAEGESAQ